MADSRLGKKSIFRFANHVMSSALLLISQCAGVYAFSEELAPSDNKSQQQIIEMLLSSIEANYSQIHSIEAALEEIIVNSEPSSVEYKTQGGGRITLSFPARSSVAYTTWISGDQVRRDSVSREASSPTDTFILTNNKWSQYGPSQKTAWLRRSDQMGGISQIDIRNLGVPIIGQTIASILQSGDVASAKIETGVDRPRKIVVDIKASYGEFRWIFDPEFGYLLTTKESRHSDGSLCDYCTLTYDKVLDGRAWMPVSLSRVIFKKGVAMRPDDKGWDQKHSIVVNRLVGINTVIPEDKFIFSPPDGTTIIDVTGEKPNIVSVGKKCRPVQRVQSSKP